MLRGIFAALFRVVETEVHDEGQSSSSNSAQPETGPVSRSKWSRLLGQSQLPPAKTRVNY